MINKNTGSDKRTTSKAIDSAKIKNGPYEAEVINHLDSTYMGGLEVRLLSKNTPVSDTKTPGTLIQVKYLSPFYGVTANTGITNNSGHANSQKSYGMWFVPPDIGSRVLVIFSESGQGYWIGCIQDDYMNMMVPGSVPCTTYNDAGGDPVPVAEYNKKTESGVGRDPTKYIKPANTPALGILKEQGLDKCNCRGLTTSSARREVPSMVFGISTPGPKADTGPKVQYGGEFASIKVPHDRLGGSSFVLDDGDPSLIRKTHAKDGPPEYANIEAGESSNTNILHNELIRLRTRTGHQIIMHNSEDLIYICNSRGTAWIELTSNGKIDIYTKDDFSLHSEGNINMKSDKSIHIQADDDIHIKADKSIYTQAEEEIHVKSGKSFYQHSAENWEILVDKEGKITTKENFDQKSSKQVKVTAEKDIEYLCEKTIKITAFENIEQKSEKSILITAEENIENSAEKDFIVDSSNIILNGPPANKATDAASANEADEATEADESPRVPEHEPWDKHENLHGKSQPNIPDTFKKGGS